MAQRYKRKRKSKNKTARIALVILILCILSALIGFYGVKYIVKGSGNPDQTEKGGEISDANTVNEIGDEPKVEMPPLDENKEEEKDKDEQIEETEKDQDNDNVGITQKTKNVEITLYAYQLGGFSQMENAEAFLSELKKNGAWGMVYKSGNYKVLSYVFKSNELSEYFKDIAIGIASDSFVFKIEKNIQISYSEEEEDNVLVCINDYKNALSIISELQSEYMDYLNSYEGYSSFNEKIIKGISEIEIMRTRVGKLESDDAFIVGLDGWYESIENAFEKSNESKDLSFMENLSELYLNGIKGVQGGL